MEQKHFDYIIIGNGLAGLQLALAFAEDAFFDKKQIALIDKDKKNTNDKTWSFWEKGCGKWEHLITKKWDIAKFITSKKTLKIHLEPYFYKSIRALDFYTEAKKTLGKKSNFHFIIDEVISTNETETLSLKTPHTSYTANHIFDSRLPETFYTKSDKHIKVLQHFKGLIIDTEQPIFNPNAFTMMDYRLKDGAQTTFMYVLPFSETKALVEFTYFTPNLVEEKTYDNYIKQYIEHTLKVENYTIIETEKGIIPMTNFPFKNYNTKNITKIGTAGGWVKGSTGYSFKHTEKKVSQIIFNLKQGSLPSAKLYKRKYAFYDKIFLKVLHDENHKGEWIFNQFYSKNKTETMFKFLDESSSFKEELKIMTSLFSASFIKAFFKTL